jgi:hypothetical protein
LKIELGRAKVLAQFMNAVELKFYIHQIFIKLFFITLKTHLGDLVYEEDPFIDHSVCPNESGSGL